MPGLHTKWHTVATYHSGFFPAMCWALDGSIIELGMYMRITGLGQENYRIKDNKAKKKESPSIPDDKRTWDVAPGRSTALISLMYS